MTVTSLTPGETFTARLYKRLTTNPALGWANSYEVEYTGSLVTSGGAALLESMAQVVVDFEQVFHMPQVRFDRCVISTAVEDGVPYNPATFISVDASASVGGRGTDGSGLEPLHTCLLVRRQVPYGRQGRALYRGALQDSETTAQAGQIALTSAAQASIGTIIQSASADFLAALDAIGFSLVMRGGTTVGGTVDVRTVQGMSLAGATFKQLNNKYFDRL